MDDADTVLCLFNATVTVDEDEYVISVPRREVQTGALDLESTYRVALVDQDTDEETSTVKTPEGEPQPPVEPGEVRYVEVEDLGKQGDGIARVERGYVIIVPDADVGDRVKVTVTDVQPNFAVADVLESDTGASVPDSA